MKPITNRLAPIVGYLFFAPWHIGRMLKRNSMLVLIGSCLLLSSCFQYYYRTGTSRSVDVTRLQRLQNANKYFILHSGDNVYELNHVVITSNTIEGDLATLPIEHHNHINPNPAKSNRVKKEEKQFALIEVHLYRNSLIGNLSHVSIPVSEFNRMDVYEYDQAATKANHLFSWIGVSVGGVAVIACILVAIACNCPQVYVNNNGQYEFKSGVYSGAVYSSLEREDYLPLEGIQARDNTYQFRIGNVPEEEQFINKVQLMRVEHPAGIKVLADRNGKILSYIDPVAPDKAFYNRSDDITAALKYTDQEYYSFESGSGENGFSTVTMLFDKPSTATKGKLLVHAVNSKWSGYLNKEFVSLFGNGYEQWRRQQEAAGSANSQQWFLDQGLPMKVFVETTKGWEYVNYFALTGNTASRDMIMEIDLANVKSEKLRIRIESAYHFWDLDRAAMDFSSTAILKSSFITPSFASTKDGRVIIDEIAQQDKSYTHLTGNDFLNIEYPGTGATEDKSFSFFLVTAGYYHNVIRSDAKPDIKSLLNFKEKGAFDRFSRTKYAAIEQELARAAVK